MGVFFFEGFETIGTETGNANRSIVQPRLQQRFASFGAGVNGFLIDDSDIEGYAWASRSPSQLSGSTIKCEFPDDVLLEIARCPETQETFEHIMGFRVHVRDSIAGTVQIWAVVGLQNGGVTKSSGGQLNLCIVDCTDILIRRGGTTIVAAVEDVITPNDWNYIEIRFKVGDTGGADADPGIVIVNVNGTEVLNEASLDTDADIAGTTGLDYVGFELTATGGDATGTDYWAFDDIYCLFPDVAPYDDFLGPVRVRRFELEADDTAEWTPSIAADHYTLVDENGADDSDYIESDTTGQSDTFQVVDFGGAGTIYALKVEAEAINTVGGTPELNVSIDGDIATYVVDDTVDYQVFTVYQDAAGFDSSVVGVQFDSGF